MKVLWTNCLDPFSPRLWAALVGIIVLIATSLTITERAARYCKSNEALKTPNYSFHNSLFYIFTAFCQQGKMALANLGFLGKQTQKKKQRR
jgi:hypothetical protein